MTERRKTERVQITYDAAAVGASAGRAIECSVRNISRGGACLVFVQRQTALPNEFSLDIEPGTARRSCRLVWQSAYRVGVQFVTGC
ncbi:MAG: PilZ domain-containing protein [Pseudomonadota bacterium]|jgi:hypothetical protein